MSTTNQNQTVAETVREDQDPVQDHVIARDEQPVTEQLGDPAAVDAVLATAEAQGRDEGVRLDNVITPRTFISKDDIDVALGGKPKGSTITIGHVAGYVRHSERREGMLPDGKTKVESIWLRGHFEATVYSTGEVRTAAWCILPRVMGEAIEGALQDGVDTAVLDIELGVEKTGRNIPYAYTVTSYMENKAQAAISTIRMRHQKRLAAKGQAQLAKSQTAALPAPGGKAKSK